MITRLATLAAVITMTLVVAGCGDSGTEADKRGIGAQCAASKDCTETGQVCLTEFKGGYCGSKGCTADNDCPTGSACVTENGTNFCFRVCADKTECNVNRDVANEANCSSSVTFVDSKAKGKACLPPSSGTK